MWQYVKQLQYPISIKNKDLNMAKYIITQFGGPNGELGASLRYISQSQHPNQKRIYAKAGRP